MKGLAGVVVLYYPDKNSLFQNIHSYLDWTDRLFIINNSAKDDVAIQKEVDKLGNKIWYIPCLSNIGVAAALNKAADEAISAGFNWLLTMDQDSYFQKDQAALFFSQFSELFYADPSIGIVSPSIEKTTGNSQTFSEGIHSITSGSLVNLNAYKDIGKFDEQLFIDEVDYDYSCRLKLNSYKIMRFNNIYLEHSLGKKVLRGFMGFFLRKQRIVHSPQRLYFIVRNYLYVRGKYKKQFPALFKERDKQFMHALKNNVFFSGNFFKALSNVVRGYMDYRNRYFNNRIGKI